MMHSTQKILFLIIGIILLINVPAHAREDYSAITEQDCEVCHLDRYYPGADFFEAEDNYKWKIFWVLTALTAGIFLIGMANNISLWRLGKMSSLKGKIKWGPVLKALFNEALLEKRIFKTSVIRWSVFFGISMGFVFLFIAFILFVALKLTSGLDFIEPSSFHLTLDFLLDLFGLFILIGLALATVRRYIARSSQMENLIQDTIAVGFIFLIIISGFLLEGFRVATLPASSELTFSFMGSIIGSLLKPYDLPWTVYHYYLWLFHAAISLAFVAYIPFGKIRHFIACPISIAATASDEAHFEEHKSALKG